MKTADACLQCFERGISSLLSRLVPDEHRRRTVLDAVKAAEKDFDTRLSPPENARKVYRLLHRLTGIADPYLELKDRSTECALEIQDSIAGEFDARPDRFEASVRLAVAGNIIDFGANPDLTFDEARAGILGAFGETLSAGRVEKLRRKMENARAILYVLDNCGEAVFDRLLIEPFADKITLAVRGIPVLNDITRRELADSRLENLAKAVVDTGDGTPGVGLSTSGKAFLDAFADADLVLAKGQGNYETLEGRHDRDYAFLFRAKCPIVIRELNTSPLAMRIEFSEKCPC